jgi:two-component system sensor histidine kinase BaeS
LERFLGSQAGGEDLAQAQAASSQLGAMVDDMLFLARLERDPMAVRPEDPITLKLLLAGGNLAYRSRAAEAGLTLKMVAPEEDVQFRGDERRLNQVVANLLDNAIKFTPRGGEVVLRGGRRNGTVWISVADSGPGVPLEERGRIFGKFVQIRSDEGRSAGLGLGLAICQRVVRAHEGEIEASAAPDGGALFTLRLPEAPRLPRQTQLPGQTQSPAGPSEAGTNRPTDTERST